MDKSQRMELKALICCLGFLLLIILLLGQMLAALFGGNEEQEIHIPVITHLSNVWIMDADSEGILGFCDGEEVEFTYGDVYGADTETEEATGLSKPLAQYAPEGDLREQIADIVLTDGAVTDIQIKTDKINGKVLSAGETFVEVEGYGKLPLASDYRGYRIYNTLTMCTAGSLPIGYNFADLVIENGEICGLLIVKEEAMEVIRVLIKSGDYSGLLHEQVILTSDSNFTIEYGEGNNLLQEQYPAGEEIVIDLSSGYFTSDRIVITPKVLTGKIKLESVNRSQGTPEYRGHLELLRTDSGIAVVNEVLLEEYLYSVVPSEMPASYPKEALKAQAICARTYAYGHMLNAGYAEYGAHVDDSTSYQVYNNISEQESATTAVKETYGQLLYTAEGGLAGTYYYSTSCGVGSDANVWKTEEAKSINYLSAKAINQQKTDEMITDLQDEDTFSEFITSKNADDFEVAEGWYRWSYKVKQIDVEKICQTMQSRYRANASLVLTYSDGEYVPKEIEKFQEIEDMYISRRGAGGIADELIIVTEEETYKVISEHNIRYVLNNGESKILRQDGSEVDSPTLLPSAFFALTVGKEKDNVVGYTLSGGGFGHGVGMSQNGAKNMAQCGYSANDILMFFYDNCTVRIIYN